MKNLAKRLIAFVLMICTFGSTLLLSSCYNSSIEKYFPEGFTGGFGIDDGSGRACYWVEAYEECQAAIELLKSHGSTFSKTAIFTYEGDLFDTKYCLSINIRQADKIKYGENPFDRYAGKVTISSYAFYEGVTIDELNYSYVENYSCYKLAARDTFFNLYKDNGSFTNDDIGKIDSSSVDVIVYGQDSQTVLLSIHSMKRNREKIPESGANAILQSIAVIGLQ